jgi:hypothetical protein
MLAEHEDARVANVALVRRFIEAINDSWNVDVMRELVSDDFLFVIPFAPDWFRVRHEGKESALAFYLEPTRFVPAVGGAVVPPPTMTAGR